MQFLLFLLAATVLGVVGVIGIYVKFLTVLIALTAQCLKLGFESVFDRTFSAGAARRLFARKG